MPADEMKLRARRRKRRSMTAARKVPHSTDAAVSGSTDEPRAAPRPSRLALPQPHCRQLHVILKHGALPPFSPLVTTYCGADNVRAATEPSAPSTGQSATMSRRDCHRDARERPPPPHGG